MNSRALVAVAAIAGIAFLASKSTAGCLSKQTEKSTGEQAVLDVTNAVREGMAAMWENGVPSTRLLAWQQQLATSRFFQVETDGRPLDPSGTRGGLYPVEVGDPNQGWPVLQSSRSRYGYAMPPASNDRGELFLRGG